MSTNADQFREVNKIISKAFVDLEREEPRFYALLGGKGFNQLESNIQDMVHTQACKAHATQIPARPRLYRGGYGDAEEISALGENLDAEKAKQFQEFKKVYFSWSLDLVNKLKTYKLRNDLYWLDLEPIAKKLGAFEI
jgi:hypothetical protein